MIKFQAIFLLACWLPFQPCASELTRLVSTNLCTDQLLLLLAKPEQILSLSELATDREHSFLWQEAAAYPTNRGSAEELIRLQPDRVLVSSYSPRTLRQRLNDQQIPFSVLPAASNLEEIQRNIRLVAQWCERPETGEALIERLQNRLSVVAQPISGSTSPAGLFLQPNGYTSGKQTLQHEAMMLAGWRNLAAEIGIKGYQRLYLEQIVRLNPKRIFTSTDPSRPNSLALRILRHPAIEAQASQPELVDYRYWICGGPMLVEAVEQLTRIRLESDSS